MISKFSMKMVESGSHNFVQNENVVRKQCIYGTILFHGRDFRLTQILIHNMNVFSLFSNERFTVLKKMDLIDDRKFRRTLSLQKYFQTDVNNPYFCYKKRR